VRVGSSGSPLTLRRLHLAISARFSVALLVGAALSLGVGASDARPAKSDTVTISMLAYSNQQPGYGVLIPNFERVYPNIKINVTYAATTPLLQQLEATELAAGNAPDLLTVQPACGTPISVCVLAKAGELAPMIDKPWVKRSVPLVTAADKYGQGLYAFSAQISPYGIFANDNLFKKLGLKVPQTFAQLLGICQKAKADGTVAFYQSGDGASIERMVGTLAVSTVYRTDPKWTAELKAGTVSFDGTAGWHAALQELIDMNSAGCFEPGFIGTTTASAAVGFAQGQSLMFPNTSSQKGVIDAAIPQFAYSFDPFPGGTAPNQTTTALNLNFAPAVNAHVSAQNQTAAQTFIDFLARPKQTALYAQIQGGVTQYEFLTGQIPTFMSDFSPIFKNREYVVLPEQTWWNASIAIALQTGVGVLTGQRSIDDVLNAMDAAWKQGPS
jgi:raffinose/stachyose/melibiose transport system substrate-binding protein